MTYVDMTCSGLPLYILGAGGHGKVVLDAAQTMRRFIRITFLDADPAMHGQEILGTVVAGDADSLPPPSDACVFVAVGMASGLRVQLIESFREQGYRLPSIIHERAYVAPDVLHGNLGPGCFCGAGAVISPGAKLGAGCIVNTGASVDHDCRLGDGVHVSPGAHLAGNVIVGPRTHIGTGASTRHGTKDAPLRIGADTVIGAGAAVISDIPDLVTAVGVPAKVV